MNEYKKRKEVKSRFSLLTYAVILHIFSLICSIYRDTYRGNNGYWKINYGILLFSWWCAQTSLITIVYFVRRTFKRTPPNYFDKVLELMVINANIIAIVMFTLGAATGNLALPKSSEIINLFGGEVSSRKFWGFYAVIWHYLAPLLTLIYFKKNHKTNLENTYSARRKLFLYSFLHPLAYFGMVLLRHLIPGSQNYSFSKELPDYPYFFFEGVGMRGVKQIFWSALVVFFGMLIFGASALLFGRFTRKTLK